MPYIRQRGNHLAIVHGARHPTTKKVEQQVLLTIHSKAEALAALGRTGNGGEGKRLQALLEERYPTVRFDWKAIARDLDDWKERLPDVAASRDERAFGDFRENLLGFTRQLAIADPQALASARSLLEAHRVELAWLGELLRWRLDLLDRTKESEWSRDPFGWRLALQGIDMPPETEEMAAEFYERGETERAEKVFGLLVDAFPSYAEGWNYLGLIALRHDEVALAVDRFEKTIRIGRTLFRRKLAKKDYWHVLETRPYIRGMSNLVIALTRAERYDDALEVIRKLETECGEVARGFVSSTLIHLNRGGWRRALDAAAGELSADDALVRALASFELGRLDDARLHFVHASLMSPRMVAIVLGWRAPDAKNVLEAEDHNRGVELRASLAGYLDRRSGRAKRFMRDLWNSPEVTAAREEVVKLEREWGSGPREDRRPFDRLHEMRKVEFAEFVAAQRVGDGRAPQG